MMKNSAFPPMPSNSPAAAIVITMVFTAVDDCTSAVIATPTSKKMIGVNGVFSPLKKLYSASYIVLSFSKFKAPDMTASPTKSKPKPASALPSVFILSLFAKIVTNAPIVANAKKKMVKLRCAPLLLPSAMIQAASVVPMFAPMIIAVA